jgi:hypothetical protein
MFSSNAFRISALAGAVMLGVGLPAAAGASPVAMTKQAKKPAFQAAVHWSHEKASLTSSLETFTTAGTRLPKGDRVISWTASFGDSAAKLRGTTLPKSFTHSVKHGGKTSVQLSLVDARGKHSTVKVAYVAAGEYTGPHAVMTIPTGFHQVGQPVVATVTPGTWDRLSASISVKFGDGTITTVKSPKGAAVAVPHLYASPGSYVITSIVSDSRHGAEVKQSTVTVAVATIPRLVGLQSTVVVGAQWYGSLYIPNSTSMPSMIAMRNIACSATNATVALTNSTEYTANPTVTWTVLGDQTVSCSFVDPAGVGRSASATVDVVAPSFTLHDDLDNTSGYSTHDTPYVTYSLGPRTVTSWSYDPGNGTPVLSGTGAYQQQQLAQPYSTIGEFTDRLTLTLDDGEQLTDYGRLSVVVPSSLSVSYTTDGRTVTLQSGVTKDARATWATWSISWGDGTSDHGTGQIPSPEVHTYPADGSYDINVVVWDDHESAGIVSFTATVP